jgi:DNA-binding transcriptional LysR family regulator
MRFDLTDLRLFLNVLEAGSITHGATRSHLALASASARLRGMEERAGVPLLVRSRSGIKPTEAGDAVAHHARLIVQQSAQLQAELDTFSNTDRGTIRLLANTAALTTSLPNALAPWLARHPDVRIDLHERTSTEIANALDRDLADLGVFSAAAAVEGFTTYPFAVDQLVAVMCTDHHLLKKDHIGLADLEGLPYIGLPAGSALQAHVESRAQALGFQLNVRIRMLSFDGICRLAASGAGVGIMPEAAATACAQHTAFRWVRLADEWARRDLVVGHRSHASLSPAALKLLAHLSAWPQPAPTTPGVLST